MVISSGRSGCGTSVNTRIAARSSPACFCLDPKLEPAAAVNLKELLEECATVMAGGYFLERDRPALAAAVSDTLAAQGVSSEVTKALEAAEKELRDQGEVSRELTAEQQALSDWLQRLSDQEPGLQYVYHGTIYGRLERIRQQGLIAGLHTVWASNPDLQAQCSQRVFVADRWRNAAFFASAARLRSRGPLNGRARLPVVIRAPREGLTLERDPLANRPGCWMTQGPILPNVLEVALGGHSFLPEWLSLSAALSTTGVATANERGRTRPT